MPITDIADITTAIKGQIITELGVSYKELAYVEDVAKNSFRTSNNRYGVRALVAGQLPGVTKFVTLNQEFEIILTKGYIQSSIDDTSQVTGSLDLRAELLSIYKRLINTKAGLPGTVLNITDLILSSPEYLEDDKVVIQRATMNIQYRYSLI